MLYKQKLLLLIILFIGLFFRLYGNNWDQGWHLHPDERFLTMVGIDVKIPPSITQYLDQYISSFNPTNKGHAFFVYGTFPLLINKALAQFLYNDTYDLFHLQGRVLSGLADFSIILVIYKLVELVEKKFRFFWSIKYLSAFLYAIAVLPIQLSHFFTVDTFLNLFCWISFYFAVKLVMCSQKCSMLHTTCYICLTGLFLGLALACKVSALYFAPLIGILMCIGLWKRGMVTMTFGLIFFMIFCYFALRLGSPYYFETGNILNPQISKTFMSAIQTLKSFDNPQVLFPPANQWVHASPFLSIINLIFFGVGPAYFLFAVLGFLLSLKYMRNKTLFLVLIWIVGFTFYQSVQFAKTMRYLIFVYPFLSIFAAVGLQNILHKVRHFAFSIRLFIYFIIGVGIIVWPLAFMSIYTKDHSRVSASKWIYNNVQANSTFLTEYWDDPLPLVIQDPRTRNYRGKEVHIFDPDTGGKWEIINDQLHNADYYIMSSNRGWGSISTTPERYPIASQFYKKMLKGEKGYTLIKEFSSYPSLRYLGIPIEFKDQWSEEAFTVYDHPLVYIFKKNI